MIGGNVLQQFQSGPLDPALQFAVVTGFRSVAPDPAPPVPGIRASAHPQDQRHSRHWSP